MIVGMSETMEKFTLKIGKELRCYELDEDKKQLHITVQKRQKVTWKQNVDLQNVYANFYESAPEKPPVFKLIIAYMVLVLNILIMAAAIILLAKEGKLFSWMFVGALLFPAGFAGESWELICEWRHNHTGEFYFNSDSDEDEFEIYYLPANRDLAYEFVCKVSQYCVMNKVRTQVIAEHEFENFYVKLFENDLALCDENGNEEMAIRYLDIEENVELIDKKHTVNNIIFGTLAVVFFGAALFLFGFAAVFPIYMAVKGFLDLAIILTGIFLSMTNPLSSMAINAYSRKAEYRADKQAVMEGYGEAMIIALKKLAKENFAELAPTRISVLLEYSHPPLADRISAVERLIKDKESLK